MHSTTYTFVAYDGVSGTTRHPILIECTREHIKFLQEDVSLSSADVSGYSPSYNPVLAGAQALVDYWSTHSAPGILGRTCCSSCGQVGLLHTPRPAGCWSG